MAANFLTSSYLSKEENKEPFLVYFGNSVVESVHKRERELIQEDSLDCDLIPKSRGWLVLYVATVGPAFCQSAGLFASQPFLFTFQSLCRCQTELFPTSLLSGLSHSATLFSIFLLSSIRTRAPSFSCLIPWDLNFFRTFMSAFFSHADKGRLPQGNFLFVFPSGMSQLFHITIMANGSKTRVT